MIKIELDDKSVFLYERETNTIHIWDYQISKWTGPAYPVGSIKFYDRDQLSHFSDMLDMLLKRGEYKIFKT